MRNRHDTAALNPSAPLSRLVVGVLSIRSVATISLSVHHAARTTPHTCVVSVPLHPYTVVVPYTGAAPTFHFRAYIVTIENGKINYNRKSTARDDRVLWRQYFSIFLFIYFFLNSIKNNL